MEVAGGLLAAEQIVSTTIEGGVVAGYAISRPTLPLKASFSTIGGTRDEDATTYVTVRDSLRNVMMR